MDGPSSNLPLPVVSLGDICSYSQSTAISGCILQYAMMSRSVMWHLQQRHSVFTWQTPTRCAMPHAKHSSTLSRASAQKQTLAQKNIRFIFPQTLKENS